MIERHHPKLSVGTQCRLLSISRSSFYYAPQGETAENLSLMRLIDRQFLETPFYGVQQMTWHLRNEGHAVNVKRIRRLMRLMRLMPIYQKPDTSQPANAFNCMPGRPGRRQRLESDAGSPTTTTIAHTLPMAVNRPPWSTSTLSKPISRCRQ